MMKRRDYFAANAPQVPDIHTYPFRQWYERKIVELGGGMKELREIQCQESWVERNARWAVEYADALLSALDKGGAA